MRVLGLCLSDLAAQLREQGGVDAEAFDALFDEGFTLLVGQGCIVEQFAVAVLEDLGLGSSVKRYMLSASAGMP